MHRPRVQVPADDPDALYSDRENLASAKKAADIWAARLAANPKDFESAWKLAQARYWLGTNGLPEPERKAALEAGHRRRRARRSRSTPNGPRGTSGSPPTWARWPNRSACGRASSTAATIKDALLTTVLKLDPAFLQGSADRALGRWYFKVPGLFGGSNKKSEEHLRKSLTYNPNSIISHFFLAETLADMGRKDEARKEAASGDRRAGRSELGAGGSAIQGTGKAAARNSR